MPDITLCQDIDCPLRKDCRRSIENYGHLSEHQSYFMDSPRDKNGCDEFWPKPGALP